MSRYPDNMKHAEDTIIVLQCDKCGHQWDARAIKDFGTYHLFDMDDEVCPQCKKGTGE